MLKTEELSLDSVKQFYLDCDSERQKFEILVQLYSLLVVGQSIIFVQVSGPLFVGRSCTDGQLSDVTRRIQWPVA